MFQEQKNPATSDFRPGCVTRLIQDYARSWNLLQAYDEQALSSINTMQSGMRAIELDEALTGMNELKRALMAKEKATDLFAQVRGNGLASTLGTIEQGFGGELFYPNIASRSAHLL